MTDDRAVWVKRLRGAAEATLGKAPVIPAPGAFRDERRNRLETDEGLFASLRGGVWRAAGGSGGRGGDVQLWGGAPVDAVVLPWPGGPEGRALLGDWTQQPMDRPCAGLEVWGERELSALHALWTRARGTEGVERSRWVRRGYGACRWLLENLQPDNATNYPWSVHVWVLVSGAGEWGSGLGPEARVYAETLLHNCRVGAGAGGGGG
ncbi:MAG: hypothetical protein K2Q09_01575, partial [Phycisphaerales bacterium]|nr:hypothetical protein [Phycisphaerales bacterium]